MLLFSFLALAVETQFIEPYQFNQLTAFAVLDFQRSLEVAQAKKGGE